VVVDPQPHLGANDELGHAHEHVERVRDAAVGRVLEWDDPKLDVSPLYFLEHGRDAPHLHELDRMAESFDGGELAEAVFWPEIGNLQSLLEGARAAYDLAEDRAHRLRGKRTLVRFEHVVQDFFFADRGEYLRTVIVLELSDLGGMCSTIVN